jgi:hypothetical protein
MAINPADIPVAKDQYLSFDGLAIRDKIIQRLNDTGIINDQAFIGSNISVINDIVSISISQILFYLNKNSNEVSFSETQLYENMNRLVKDISYNPIGFQTSTVPYKLFLTSTVGVGTYYIPRYSFIDVKGKKYSFPETVTFYKDDAGDIEIEELANRNLLFQGQYIAYPTQTAAGIPRETISLITGDNISVDYFHIDVYVKNTTTNKWVKWERTEKLFLNTSSDSVYEVRYDENRRHTIIFGDNVTGKQLTSGQEVLVVYLASDGSNGVIASGELDGKRITLPSSPTINAAITDTQDGEGTLVVANAVYVENTYPATNPASPESVEQIRQNAPAAYKSQFRLVTESDFEQFVTINFANIVKDVKCMGNNEFLDTYMKYFYDLGITKITDNARAFINQIEFSTSNNTNNVYLILSPNNNNNYFFVPTAIKSLIKNSTSKEKLLTSNIVFADPVYLEFSLGIPDKNENPDIEDLATTKISLRKNRNSQRSDSSIRQEAATIIQNYFENKRGLFGENCSATALQALLIAIDGVSSVFTINGENRVEGVSLYYRNPLYDFTLEQLSGQITTEDFQSVYYNRNVNILDQVVIENFDGKSGNGYNIEI